MTLSEPAQRRRRVPKDLAGTLMTAACVETLLEADGLANPHQWEALQYGTRPPTWNAGPKTRGSLARSRSAQFVVSPPRLAEWMQGRPAVAAVARSCLWDLLRCRNPIPDALTPDGDEGQFDDTAYLAFHRRLPLMPERLRDYASAPVMIRLASCRSFDAIAAMWILLQEAQARQDVAVALHCARYVPPALALLADTRAGARVAMPIFARMRQITLDGLKCDGRSLRLEGYDLPAVSRFAQGVPRPTVQGSGLARRLVVPNEVGVWIEANLAEIAPHGRRRQPTAWLPRMGPLTHPASPCHPTRAMPAFHRDAIARMRAELGKYA